MEKCSTLGLAEAQPAQPIDIVESALRSAKQQIEALQEENEILRVKAEAFDTLARLTRVNYGGEACISSGRRPWYIEDALHEIECARNENSADLDASDLAPADDGDQTDEITLFKEAMSEFCNKVEAGQIKSRHTYVKFCRLLGRPTFFDHIGDESCERAEGTDAAPGEVQWPGPGNQGLTPAPKQDK